MCESDQRNPGVEILVTPAMIEAGVEEMHEFSLGGDLSDLAERVFTAMLFATLLPRQLLDEFRRGRQ